MSLLPLPEARRHVFERCRRLPVVRLPLAEALGLVTAAGVVAAEPVPPFANTAMDGYAVRAADTGGAPVTLEVVGTLAAGAAPEVGVGPGQAVRIMTGAPMPPGADAVVMVERTRSDGPGRVLIEAAAAAGDNVRHAGDDVRPGQEVVAVGTALGPGHLGVLASVGAQDVEVVRQPRVGVLSTGDELVEGSAPLKPGQIRDSNRRTLLALVSEAGCEPVDLGAAPDREDAIETAVTRGVTGCDAVLTSGGVSVGDFDYVKVVLDRLSGGSMRWMQIAIRPAKPFAFGTVGGVPVFGLPGNPVSSMVSFEVLARPALRRMMGHLEPDRPRVLAVADEDLRRHPDGKLHLMRVTATFGPDGRVHVRSAGGQGSHVLTAMAAAGGLALLDDGDGVSAGGDVETLLLGAPLRAAAAGPDRL